MLVRHRALALFTVGTAVVACGTATADAAAAGRITGGSTTISLSTVTAKTLAADGVALSAVKPATRKSRTLKFPNGGGTANQGNFRIVSQGGILLVHGKKRVSITKLVLNTATSRIAGTITGHRNTTVFTLGEPMGGRGSKGSTQLGPYTVTWAADAAKTLNHDLRTSAFTADKRAVGTGTLDVRYTT